MKKLKKELEIGVEIRGKLPSTEIEYNSDTKVLTLYANTTYDPCIVDGEVFVEYGTGIILNLNDSQVGQLFQTDSIKDVDLNLLTYLIHNKVKDIKYGKELVLSFKLNAFGQSIFEKDGIDTCNIYTKGEKIAEILFN